MFAKPKFTKDSMVKLITICVIASILMLTLSILTDDYDSRSQISDDDGATELCSILSEIKGAGQVHAMLQYDKEQEVQGVIVTAEGAKDPVVKTNIIKGVCALYNIPVSNVMVFEKEKYEEELE